MVLIALFTLFSVNIFAQVTVTGTVLDDLGEGAAGATIREKGTQNGAAADINGKFTLKVQSAKATLVVSYVGFETQETALNGRTNVTINLKTDAQILSEVVTIGYGTQNKVTLTGAVSNVSSDELIKAPVVNLGNALQGHLPGVQAVQYSGMPGADDPVIRLRGIGTLNSAEPLVLVDGVERPFTQLDPNEVQDISILKDASATAVFGVRGANGVILVTTKRGHSGKASVSATASAAVHQISEYVDFADSYTYGRMYNYAQITDAFPVEKWLGTSYIDDYSPYHKPTNEKDIVRFSQQAMEHFKNGDMPMTYPNVNWMDYLMKSAAWQEQANVNVSGGTDKVRYFISTGIFNQNSLFKTFSDNPNETFKYNRYNYRANVDIDVSKYSTLSLTLGGRVENRTTVGMGEEELFRYLQGSTPYSSYGIDDQGRLIVTDPTLVGPYDRAALTNFYKLGYNYSSKNVLNFDLQYKLDMSWLTQGLDFKVKASYNSEYVSPKSMKSGYGTGTQYVATIVDGQEVLRKEGVAWPATYEESDGRYGSRNWYTEASFNYSRKFGLHNVGALVLYNQSKTYYPWDSDGLYSSIPKGYVGLVGRITYDYDLRYLFDFNIGYNGSENFAKGKRYGTFPSFSIGWITSNEKFWESIRETVGYLKLRASWGKVGNDNTNGARFMYLPGSWSFYNGHMSGNPLNSGTNFGVNPGSEDWLKAAKELTAGNPDVTWETATKINLGLDARFIDDKLSLNLDFFWEDRKDILVSNEAMLPAVTSLPSGYLNRGRVKNHGYEITLDWHDKIGQVQYHISPNFTFARNKIIDMLEVKPMYDYLARTGNPVGTHFVYELFEYYNKGTEERYEQTYGTKMPDQGVELKYGDCVYVDLNGDGMIDANDQHAYGHTDIPEINYSLNAGLSWKGLDFSMMWVGADNVNRMLSTYYRDQFGSTNTSALAQWVADNSWTEDNQDAILPRISFTNRVHNNHDSRAWLVNTRYIRLKNIEIGYTINKPKFAPILNSVRFFINAQNLLTFTDFKGNDPEADGGNWQTGIKYPMTRIFNFGAKVNF
ncbi:MAG: TonB-dependent receptor [Bacteroidaceae bacterium]|nr:TonB-dependent receptor [Bacteroidaceae bacterium]